ncbi:glycosyltransferase [Staphylococcus condimenti]|uniref:Glycosyltransferase n=1 Tax=Staphylococcus condimenti TaxID=70255 RepID=A0A4Q7CLE3_9STAP|nr:glycosyltransferase [Staphylococcus condimenti]RZI00885.1 glycosyltransferase [Staphylococcus condimenti]RZI01553.1 glycosyltransferase [Staphylococcus condimenti]
MNKIGKVFLNQASRKYKFIAQPIKGLFKSPYVAKTTRYAKYYKSNKIKENCILYQSRDGKSMTDSPYAVFLYLLSHNKYKYLKHIWVVDTQKKKEDYAKIYKDYSNVEFIVKESNDYLQKLTTAKYILNNSTFPAYFTKKENQVYVNTWHGTPIKAMGLDVEDNLLGSQNIIKNFLSSDILVSPNSHTSEVFKRAFSLDGLYSGELLEIGYPRIDLTLNANKKNVFKHLKQSGLHISNREIILFAPTWRGSNVNKPEDSLKDVYRMVMELKNNTEYQVLVKVHPFVYKTALKYKELKPYLVPDSFDTNELLSVIDLLVTDYSSIFFDYLITDKPIIFYSPDYEDYKNDRGFYIKPDALPGPSVFNTDDLIETVNQAKSTTSKYARQYQEFKDLYVPYEDGQVTERLIDAMFSTKKGPSLKTKETILMYPGGMKNNGITTSAINLLENINYDKYDVTIFLNNTHNTEILKNLSQVNENVRIILRKGPLLASTSEKYRDAFVKNRGLKSPLEKIVYPTETYEREFRKIFGNSNFDYVVDFSGYSMFWSKILLGTHSKRKLMYLHSDIKSDMNRTVNGNRPHYVNLKGVISLYYKFDYLVSVSEETCKINLKNLATPSTREKFVSAMNTINLPKIQQLLTEDTDFFTHKGHQVLAIQKDNEITSLPFNESDYKVMAMGRLSPEKGFDNLINGFSNVVKDYPTARLYILGDGPLRKALEDMIKRLNIEDNVFLVGQKGNPFNIMKRCDLFALTSHYEGQSMVLLEALTIGINALASDIPANRYVLKAGDYGMLTENTPELIEENIRKFMNHTTPSFEHFDAHQHNTDALEQFYSLLH